MPDIIFCLLRQIIIITHLGDILIPAVDLFVYWLSQGCLANITRHTVKGFSFNRILAANFKFCLTGKDIQLGNGKTSEAI